MTLLIREIVVSGKFKDRACRMVRPIRTDIYRLPVIRDLELSGQWEPKAFRNRNCSFPFLVSVSVSLCPSQNVAAYFCASVLDFYLLSPNYSCSLTFYIYS